MKTSFTLPKLHGHFGRGTNATHVTVNGIDLYYSYQTLVAFRSPKTGALIVRRNDWGTTTGGHLNAIDGGSHAAKSDRVDGEAFARLFSEHTGSNV